MTKSRRTSRGPV